MAGLGYPILGDTIYAANDKWDDAPDYAHSSLDIKEDIQIAVNEGGGGGVAEEVIEGVGDRLHLHAHTLSFNHPITNQSVRFVADCPF